MFRFSIRELLLLTVIVGLLIGRVYDQRQLHRLSTHLAELKAERQKLAEFDRRLNRWTRNASHTLLPQYTRQLITTRDAAYDRLRSE